MVLLDTCCLIELCRQNPALSDKTRFAIEAGAHILSVSFAEIALKIKLGKLILDISPEDLNRQYLGIPSLSIIDIGCREWFDAINLKWPHKDPVDRLLVGYAKRHNLVIVTTDGKIKRFHRKVIW